MANNVLSISFNQDFGCFACGTQSGFIIYNTDQLKKNYHEKFDGGIECVEMLFRCNYVALVGGGRSPAFPRNIVVIWDVVDHKEVMRLEMNENVKAVRLRRDFIVVVLCEAVEVYSFTNDPTALHVYSSYQNPYGACCLCQSSDNAMLVFPSASSPGAVSSVNLGEIDAKELTLAAHRRPIVALALNSTGSLLATASEKGTIIRIFNASNLTPLKELRRGTNPAHIHCSLRKLSFSGESSFSKFQLPFIARRNDVCLCSFGPQPDSVIAISSDGNYCKFNYEPLKGNCVRQTCSLYLEAKE